MRDELYINASDNDIAPEFSIPFQIECDWIIINQSYSNNKLNPKFNWVRDELTFNASDNDVAPESPILPKMECDWMMTNQQYSIINSIPGPIEWALN